ncbi:NAD-dependent epimerase/dehydratase family protein [Pseudomonas sp. RIT-To-2]|uniref:NAD-dependent epimerase/dehydratase family protein n=1 Tax=Pseudomonas sp. RIT-To-2 TaxID=3462541 RepID=UPI0024132B17
MTHTVALTGATGFIGQHIVQALLRQGFTVRALTRRTGVDQPGLQWVHGALDNPASLAELVRGAEAVIHCAGQVRGRDRATFQHCNVDGTRRLVTAAKAAGHCERVLLISSLAARHPQLSWYAESKFQAERQAVEVAGTLPVSIFRPTAVYGPGDRELQPVFTWLLRGWLPRVGAADARLSFLHVQDLAQACLRWLAAAPAGTACYELNDGAPQAYSWPGLQAMGARVRGAPVRQVSIAPLWLRRLSRLNLAWQRLAGGEPMLTPAKVNELLHPDWSSSNRAIAAALGWRPGIALECALRERSF